MSLNNISLPVQLVATLYHHLLVDGSVRPVPKKKEISFLGGNKKNILIIITEPATAFLPDKEMAFLTTVLSACQLTISDVAIANRHHANQEAALLRQLAPKQILFLDTSPELLNLPLHILPYEVHEANNIKYVYAPSLSEIEKTKQAKSRLWLALKQLFCL